ADKKVTLVLTEVARKFFAEKGYSKQFGARPMGRVIQAELKRPLADAILFGDLQHGGQVTVGITGEGDARKLDLTLKGNPAPVEDETKKVDDEEDEEPPVTPPKPAPKPALV